MFANWIEQTTTTTGTGNLTVASVSGRKSIHGDFGTGRRFLYTLRASDGTPLECGVGRMSDSTTLVREWVFEINNAGTFSKPNSSSGQLSLPAGTKTITVSAEAGSMALNPPAAWAKNNATANQRLMAGGNAIRLNASNLTLTANRLYGWPQYVQHRGPFDALTLRAGASGNVDLCVFEALQSGLPGDLITSVSGAVVSGMNVLTLTSFSLPPGFYCFGVNASAGITVYFSDLIEGYGRDSAHAMIACAHRNVTQGSVPSSFGTPDGYSLSNAPTVMLRYA